MGASNKYYLRLQEQEVNDLPEYLRDRITFIDDNTYKEHEEFEPAYKKYVKAKKELETVKFNIRNKQK